MKYDELGILIMNRGLDVGMYYIIKQIYYAHAVKLRECYSTVTLANGGNVPFFKKGRHLASLECSLLHRHRQTVFPFAKKEMAYFILSKYAPLGGGGKVL